MFPAQHGDGLLVDMLSLCGNEMAVDRIPFGCLFFPKALLLLSALPVLVFFGDEGERVSMTSSRPDQKPALEARQERAVQQTKLLKFPQHLSSVVSQNVLSTAESYATEGSQGQGQGYKWGLWPPCPRKYPLSFARHVLLVLLYKAVFEEMILF